VRNARVVLVDPERVRAVMTASWLNQMGWSEVYVLADWNGLELESGRRAAPILGMQKWKTIAPTRVSGTVLDFSTSLRFAAGHIPGAWWAVRSRLEEARSRLPKETALVLTSEDGLLAHLVAPEAAALWPAADVKVLDGGNAAWFAAGHTTAYGMERATTTTDDVAYKAYDHRLDQAKHARAYLDWEVALIEQMKREPAIRFRTY
jgi:hypothetical protein